MCTVFQAGAGTQGRELLGSTLLTKHDISNVDMMKAKALEAAEELRCTLKIEELKAMVSESGVQQIQAILDKETLDIRDAYKISRIGIDATTSAANVPGELRKLQKNTRIPSEMHIYTL